MSLSETGTGTECRNRVCGITIRCRCSNEAGFNCEDNGGGGDDGGGGDGGDGASFERAGSCVIHWLWILITLSSVLRNSGTF